jgi:hypothetical protein
VAKFLAQRDTPQTDHRMRLAVGSGYRELRVLVGARPVQTRHEIARQERTIRRGAQHPGNLRPVRRGPIEAGEDACERSGKILDRIRDHRQAKIRKSRRVAVGVEEQLAALRPKPRDHAREDGLAADRAHRLVAAAHPARQPAGQ